VPRLPSVRLRSEAEVGGGENRASRLLGLFNTNLLVRSLRYTRISKG
jgi:hypothetical protein